MDGLNDQLTINTSMLGPNQPLLVVSGEIEFRTAPMLRAAIDESLDGTVAVLTIDLAAVSFIDSSGLAVLVDAHTRNRRTPPPLPGGRTSHRRDRPVIRARDRPGITAVPRPCRNVA